MHVSDACVPNRLTFQHLNVSKSHIDHAIAVFFPSYLSSVSSCFTSLNFNGRSQLHTNTNTNAHAILLQYQQQLNLYSTRMYFYCFIFFYFKFKLIVQTNACSWKLRTPNTLHPCVMFLLSWAFKLNSTYNV